jgi:Domain of unknown function (DUF6473)
MFPKKYAADDAGIVDYQYYQLPGTDKWFRGPRPELESRGRAVAFLGAASCFGRFVARPYPELVGERLARPMWNFGYGGARAPFYYRDPALMRFINQSAAVVVGIFSARGTGTSRIESRNDASAFLRWAGSRADFVFADHFFNAAWREAPGTMAGIVAEIRRRYVEQMHSLLWRLEVPTVLLWLSQRAPDENADYRGPERYELSFPHLLDRAMLDEIGQGRVATVEVVSQAGLPQPLPEPDPSAPAGHRRPPVNRYYPSPEMHRIAADRLAPMLSELLETPGRRARVVRSDGNGPAERQPLAPVSGSEPVMRNVLAHCHIFKNAGSSIDRSLKRHFGAAWADVDSPATSGITDDQLIEILMKRPNLAAVSAHKLRFPLRGNDRIRLHPILLLRHPIDRVRSIYDFERTAARQRTSQLIHTKQAARLDFADWVSWCLNAGFGGPITNAQTRLCSYRHNGAIQGDWKFQPDATNLNEALLTLSELPVVGTVEDFETTTKVLTTHFSTLFPGLNFQNVQVNFSPKRRGLPLPDRLEAVRAVLGPELYEQLVRSNEFDLELYEVAKRRLQQVAHRSIEAIPLAQKSDRRIAVD